MRTAGPLEWRSAVAGRADERPTVSESHHPSGDHPVEGWIARFNTPTTIVEGGRRFTESIRKGAFAASIARTGAGRVLMQASHGRDTIGMCPVGWWTELEERNEGLFGRGYIFRAAATELLVRGAQRGLYGQSFAFRVPEGGDKWSATGDRRELLKIDLVEAGLTPAPAYPNTSAVVAPGPAGRGPGSRPAPARRRRAMSDPAVRRRLLVLRGVAR
ncbi:MAG: HK97 family phage prohead protease [Acidimicrobiales bacterium]